MIRRAATVALALCAMAAAASASPSSSGAGTTAVEPGASVQTAGGRALSSDVLAVASAVAVPQVWLQALPPPPTVVTLQTKSYGTVALDHPAHLARRTACRECHGAGPVRKIDFTPRIGHDRCRGCHVKVARGPTSCTGCHALPPKGEALATAAPETEPVAVVLPAPPTAAEALAALQPEPPPSFRRTVDLGVTTLASHAGVLYGPTATLVGHYGDALLAYTLSVPGGITGGRTQFLVGGGRAFALPHRMSWSALGVAGIDASFDPSMVLPAAGARVGLQRSVAWPGIRRIALEGCALVGLASRENAGRHTGDVSFGVTLSAGLPLGR